MITKEEYLKAKAIVEEYEDQEYTDGMNNAMYCTECQALEAHDCFCEEEPMFCELCNEDVPYHADVCPYKQEEEL